MTEIKQIQVGSTAYDISAKYIQSGTLNKSWTDIENLVNTAKVKFVICSTAANTPKGVKFTPQGSSTQITGTLEASAADLTTFYLVYSANAQGGSYDEYVVAGEGASAAWEVIGNTDIDLSGYATKGTYTSSTPSTNTTSSAGEQSATVSGSITYSKADTATGSAGSDTNSNTGSAGGATVNGSNFSFTGTTATISLSTDYQPEGSISGSQVVSAHSHTVNAETASFTYVTGVKASGGTAEVAKTAIKGLTSSTTTSTGAITYVESVTHEAASLGTASTTSVVTGVAADGSDTAIKTLGTGSFLTGATVESNVLKFNSGNAYNTVSASFTALKGVKASSTAAVVTGYPNFSGGGATPTTKYLTGTALAASDKATVILNTGLTTTAATFVTSATLSTSGGVTISGSNFSFSGTTATLSLETDYQPAGTIGGSQTIAAHSHTYVQLPAHTHSVGSSNATATYSLSAAVSSHTHDLGNHTHSTTI